MAKLKKNDKVELTQNDNDVISNQSQQKKEELGKLLEEVMGLPGPVKMW